MVQENKTIGLYFSGTGNTRFAVTKFASLIDGGAKSFSIEDDCIDAIFFCEFDGPRQRKFYVKIMEDKQ